MNRHPHDQVTTNNPSSKFNGNPNHRNSSGFESPLSERTDGGVIQYWVSSALCH